VGIIDRQISPWKIRAAEGARRKEPGDVFMCKAEQQRGKPLYTAPYCGSSAKRSLVTCLTASRIISRERSPAHRWESRRFYEAKASSWETCCDTMRRMDMDNMLCLTFLPKEVQEAW
jgi:hypothetical protein